MSKISQLSPEDFGQSFDPELFSEWKKSVAEHEKAGMINIVLYLVGLALLILLGGLVGLGLFFGIAFTGIAIATSKKRKRREYERKLGISNSNIRQAILQKGKRAQ